MKISRTWLLVLLAILTFAMALSASAGVLSRVVDDNNTVPVRGNVHPLARPSNDRGPTDLTLRYERMVLVLQPRPEAREELDRFLAQLHDPSSPNYRHWLTPEEFGARFGISDPDLTAVTSWLTRQGFTIDEVANGRGWINFSGNVGQVERAFRTNIHEFEVDGQRFHANIKDPEIPVGLTDIVGGVLTLHNFPRKAMNSGFHQIPAADAAALASKSGLHTEWTGTANGVAGTYTSPIDWAKIYNANSSYTANGTGTGVVIGIVGRTNPGTANWSTFRSTIGLPVNTPQIIVNGTNPGDLGAGEDGEADLDAEWSGGVAPGATVKFVASKSTGTTDGVDLSAQYIVNNNLADVMSTSFGSCEADMGSAENTFYNNLWSQAATQGITSCISTGDSGAAGCGGGNDTSGAGEGGVNGLASTPFDIAVGATQLSTSASFWSGGTPTGYIPETPWNESGTVSGGSGLWSTSSGASNTYAKPSWQVAPGVPSTSHRYLPDISLDGSDMFFGNYGMLVRTQGAMATTGGTSAASPSFAGVMALVIQKYGRQGNANTKLYPLGQAQYGSAGTVVYHDITSGNNNVPGLTGFTAATGWDEVTGLGTVDVTSLVNNWNGTATPDFAISASPTGVSVVQGNNGSSTISTTVSGGFNSAVALSATGQPTGVTVGFSPTSIAAPGSGSSAMTLTVGASTTAGTYTITVTGTGGSKTHTATVSLTVTTAATPDFTISASPTSVSVVQGFAGNSTITTAVSGGFNSAVALSATGQPAGVTVSFSPTSIAAPGSGSSTMTLSVGASTTAGSYPITVTGTGGSKTHTATVTLTVTTSGGATTLLSDGFEAAGWASTQVSGTAGAWAIVSSSLHPSISAHGGTKWADFNSYTSASGSQTRFYRSAGIAVGNYGTVTMTFWMYHDTSYTTDADRVQAQVSTNGTTWTNVGSAVNRYNGTTGWSQVTVDLSGYRNSANLQIGFLGISVFGSDCYVDDVLVTGSGTGASTYTVSGTITLSGAGLSGVTVSTAGASGSTNSSGAYTLSNLANGSYTVTPSLSGYTFSPASQAVTVSGANVSGINFTATAVTGPTTLFSDGFESTGWSTAQVSGTAGKWTLVSSSLHPSISAHGGTKWADFNSYTSASGSQTRLYRATGFAVPSSYTTVTLTFWMYHDTSYSSDADRTQAQVSTNGGTTWANVGTAVNRYNGTTGWAKVTIDVSAYKGTTINLGFLGISVFGSDIYLDDVAVSAN